MVHALGFSNTPFNPFRAGRLCRGRERWIEPWEPGEDEEAEVHRLVVSGAAFSDLSAADALRGVPHSTIEPAALIAAMFPDRKLLAFMEDGHPADIPEHAQGVELYEGYRAGGRTRHALVRWYEVVSGVEAIDQLLKAGVRGFAVLDGDVDPDTLFEDLFLLVGMATLDSPPARFQPAALPDLVEKVHALVLVHRDKHGPALGIYTAEALDAQAVLEKLTDDAGSLLVPFAIPPMLARWDRALFELRDNWDKDEPFPVAEPEGGYHWEERGRRRRSNRRRNRNPDAHDKSDDADDETEDLESTIDPALAELVVEDTD